MTSQSESRPTLAPDGFGGNSNPPTTKYEGGLNLSVPSPQGSVHGPDCAVAGCERPAKARGWCYRHYQRWRSYGDPLAGGRYIEHGLSEEQRFWRKVAFSRGCWIWLGYVEPRYGYARFARNTPDGRNRPSQAAYRYVYELTKGAIPSGMHIDHRCRNTRCVRPGHLEIVTPAENVRRSDTIAGQNARKTHCKRGHPFDATTHIYRGHRVCLVCKRDLARARYYALVSGQQTEVV